MLVGYLAHLAQVHAYLAGAPYIDTTASQDDVQDYTAKVRAYFGKLVMTCRSIDLTKSWSVHPYPLCQALGLQGCYQAIHKITAQSILADDIYAAWAPIEARVAHLLHTYWIWL